MMRGLPTCDEILWRILPSNAAVLAALRGATSTDASKAPNAPLNMPRRLRNEDSLAEMRALMAVLGLCPATLCSSLAVIHVAGTKGKGSVAAYAESIARAHGRRTLLFTSPHLVHARERVRVDGRPLADFEERVVGLYARLTSAGVAPPGLFRFMTLLFFDVCAEAARNTPPGEPRPVAVVEVGMGGRYDATNVLPSPSAAVVTSLAMEHVTALGPTLGDIARHKAGVAKARVPLVHAPQNDLTDDVIRNECQTVGALYEAICLMGVSADQALGIGEGNHAKRNAALAAAACRHALGLAYSEDRAMDGLAAARMPGRQQVVVRGDARWFLDGAHTPESVAISAEWYHSKAIWRNREEISGLPHQCQHVLVFYCAPDKDAHKMLGSLTQIAFDRAIFVLPSKPKDGDNVNSEYAASLAAVFRQQLEKNPHPSTVVQIETLPSVAEAITAVGNAQVSILVTGSLYIVGDALRDLKEPVD